MLERHTEVGSTASTYAIIAKLATGGMADIFLARTESGAGVERYVVLKRVLRHRATDIKFVHMFLDEAKLASQLQHPNIAQVYDTGKLGDSYFFTMEYVHGETVRELLHRTYAVSQKIPLACALTIVAGAAAGLQHAHERVGLDGKPLGIVHRDVSPSNLMISFEGNVKLVDFGVAKASLQSIETQSGTVKGKIGYMAPEQCRGGSVDLRCDLFSLGIVMWELLTGERLFKRNTEFESMEAIVTEASPPPSSRRPEIPPSIDTIVLKLLEKRPSNRYQCAEELHEAIESAAVGAGIALSLPALRRFIRELFGQRPEPWVEMRLREAAPEIVTVTALPIGKPDTAELQLERVLDLSSPSISVIEGSTPNRPALPRTPTPVPGRPPAPVPRAPTAPTISGTAPARPSTQGPAQMADAANASGQLVTASGAQFAVMASSPEASSSSGFAAATPPSGELAAHPITQAPVDVYAPFAAQGSSSSWSGTSHRALSTSSSPSIAPLRRSPWRAIVIACGVIVIGVVIGVVAFRAADETGDHRVHAPDSGTERLVVAPSGGSMQDTVKPEVKGETQPETVPTPKNEAEVKPKAELKPKREVKPNKAEVKPIKPDPVAASYRANRFAEVVTVCAGSSDVMTAHVVMCVLAACRVHDTAKARDWVTKAASTDHDAVVSACAKVGTVVAEVKPPPKREPPKREPPKREPPPKPKCDPTDPMSCRR